MALATIFATALGVAFSGAMMPGPLLTVTITESAKRGQRAAFLLIVGHALLELPMVVGLAYGLSQILSNGVVIRLIGLLGGAFLLWMGYSTVSSALKGKVKLDLESKVENLRFGPIFEGVATSLSNPYWTLWWATIGVTFVLKSLDYRLPGLLSFYTGHILGDFVWYGIVALTVVTGRRFLSNKVYQGVLATCGLFLLLLGVSFVAGVSLF